MQMKKISETFLRAELFPEPETGENVAELRRLVEAGHFWGNIGLDFDKIDILSASTISKLLQLKKALAENGLKLVLYSIKPSTKGILTIMGLGDFFQIAEDLEAATRLAGQQ